MTALLLSLQVQSDPAVLQEAANLFMLRVAAAAVLFFIVAMLLLGFWKTVGEDPPRVDSHWGGFGGGLGGWHMSASLAYLLGALAFAIMFVAVVQPSKPSSGTSTKAEVGKTEGAKTEGATAVSPSMTPKR